MRLCFVLLPDAQQLTPRKLELAAKQEFPELGKATWKKSKEGTSEFTLGGVPVITALMPVPVPEGEADEATDRSLSGLDGSWTLPEHRAHLVVVRQGPESNKVEELAAFTRVVAVIVRATGAVGVYWGEGGATHHPEFVMNIAQSELPLPIWVGLSVAKTKKGFELLSIGMAQLGLPNLLLRAPDLGGPTLEFFYDLLAYAARRGSAFAEGETVGRDEHERLPVTHEKSPVVANEQVWAVTIGKSAAVKVKKPAAVKAKKPAAPKAKKKAAAPAPAKKAPAKKQVAAKKKR